MRFGLCDVRLAILDFLKEVGEATRRQILRNVPYSEEEIDCELRSMIRIGCLRHDGKMIWRNG
jgi:hypothetical protein